MVPGVVIGSADDPDALRSFVRAVDVSTIDHENVDHATLASLEAEGAVIFPSVHTMGFSDKATQRRLFRLAGLPVPDFEVLDGSPDEASAIARGFAERHGGSLVAKSSRGGYDGRGVWMLDADQLDGFLVEYRGAPLVVEPRLPLDIELAVLVARSPSGSVSTWPVLQTVQVNGMCDEVVYPAPIDEAVATRAREVAAEVARVTDAVGVLAVELFVVDGEVLINEIAPRVHNSGHLTIEAFGTSQFSQHLRAVLDWPLGPTDPVSEVAVMANVVAVGDTEPRRRQALALSQVPEAHVHLYAKTPRDRRKIGHVTVLGEDRETVRARAGLAAALLGGSA